MKTNFKFTDTEHDEKLRTYTQTKLDSFEKLLGKEDADAAVCVVEFKGSKHHSGDICTVEVTLKVHGETHRVTKDETTFKKAVDKVKDDMLRSIKGNKEKNLTVKRKGCGRIKKIIHEETM